MNMSLFGRLKHAIRLPSSPSMARRTLELCQTDDIAFGLLADVIATDPALSARLLRYANSALLGVDEAISSIREAVVALGIRPVRTMALSYSLLSSNDPRSCRSFDFEKFWFHSLACAVSARHLAIVQKESTASEAYTAGLLMHIGKLAFAVAIPDAYHEVIQIAGGTLGRTEYHEYTCLGSSHYELGADLLAEWNIPTRTTNAIRGQCPQSCKDDHPGTGPLIDILRTATHLADIICSCENESLLATRRQSVLDSNFVDGETQLATLLATIQEELSALTEIIAPRSNTPLNIEQIQSETSALLSRLNLTIQLQKKRDILQECC